MALGNFHILQVRQKVPSGNWYVRWIPSFENSKFCRYSNEGVRASVSCTSSRSHGLSGPWLGKTKHSYMCDNLIEYPYVSIIFVTKPRVRQNSLRQRKAFCVRVIAERPSQ